jgi:hypothetical protein
VWTIVDGFIYNTIPYDFKDFHALATWQYVALKSSESEHVKKFLYPCWEKIDIMKFGETVMNLTKEEMDERYYYSGGSVGEFCRPFFDLESNITQAVIAITKLETIDRLFSLHWPTENEKQIERIRRKFIIIDKTNNWAYQDFRCWTHMIDSEYALREISYRLDVDHINSIYEWAKHTNNYTIEEFINDLGFVRS